MGKNGHRKLRQRQISDDVNGNTKLSNNNNNKNGHTHQNGKRDMRNGHGTKQNHGTSLNGENYFKNSIKYVAYFLVFVLLFSLFFQTHLETLFKVLHNSDSSEESAHVIYQDSEISQNPAASHQPDPQHAKIPVNHKLPKELQDFKPTTQGTIEPREIVVDGRVITPREIQHSIPNNSSVRVYMYNNFLNQRECDGLIGAHQRHVTQRENYQPIMCFDSLNTLRRHLEDVKKSHIRVSIKDFVQGTLCLNESFSSDLQTWLQSNWSYSTAFYPGESPFSHTFTERVHRATGLNPEHGGKFQLTSYPKGIGYKSHTDCLVGSSDQRDRFATILVYLKDVAKGGETQFPELGISVKPKAGSALVWNNMDQTGACDPLSVHRANTVHTGHKYIIQRWYYYENFYALGKRVDEPELPSRDPLTPRVSCDEYENGSCRWYDEWNYEHIIQYTDVRHSLH